MADNGFGGIVDSLIGGMDGFLSTKTVVGEPTRIGDTIIVPFVDVSFGVGAGNFKNNTKDNGAGGLTGKMAPSAVLVIQNGNTRLVNIKNQDAMTKILDMVPDIMDKISSRKNSDISDDAAIKAAFDDADQ